MASPFRFLRARLGRRMALLFFVCALVPISLFSALTLFRVRAQLEDHSRSRLLDLSKENAQSLVARLHFAALELGRSGRPDAAAVRWADRLWTTGDDESAVSGPDGGVSVALDEAAWARLRSSEPVLRVVAGRVILARRDSASGTIHWAELDPDYLRGWLLPWDRGTARSPLPAGMELCVLAADGPLVECPEALLGAPAGAAVGAEPAREHHGTFDWGHGSARRLAARRSVFLRPAFGAPDWTVVVSEPYERALAPAAGFERTFLLATVLSLLVIPFVSQVQIRRNLVPLERLKAGARRVARRDFGTRVDIRSGDEFEDLASDFNAMAERLGRQFGALTTASEIDRAILGALDTRSIIETVLRRGPEVLPGAAIDLVCREGSAPATVHRLEGDAVTTRPFEEPGRITGEPEGGGAVFPVRLDGADNGALIVRTGEPLSDDDRQHAAQMADRFAVALSNARLIDELDRMNLETISAFARAIDAKSPWTAGHSERVTAMALELGRELDLGEDELEVIHRGGLLHDVGKIGIPGSVLDKPGPLDEEEFRLMRSHPVIGAEIVGPITRFKRIVPIVRHHHERVDGKGYPDGLAGEAIDFLARIVAVADVYDALRSERPYRAAMKIEKVRSIIVGDRGTAFDPRVVDAFERVLERRPAGSVEPARTRRVRRAKEAV